MADKPFLINYQQLHSLWLRWLTQPDHSVLDRWLQREAADWRKNFRETMPLDLSQAMQYAVRYQQLACALELIHKVGLDQDWDTWNKKWRAEHIDGLERNHFWFWVQRRSHARWYIPKDWQAGNRQKTIEATEEYVRENPLSPLWMIWHGLRPHWLPALQRRAELSHWSDADLQRFISLQNSRPPLWLRAQADQDPKALLEELKKAGVDASLNDHGLCATGGFGITQTDAYKQGRIEIQDLASQHIAETLDAKKGDKIWDACAGAGGKALAISAAMGSKGVVVATDLHQRKLDELKKRARRAGQLNIRTFVWDSEAPLRLPAEIARQKGFDKVLIDAPCSATGTWRRNPDACWRLEPQQIQELQALQQKILTNAAPAVRTGGRLVYATCSWLEDENELAVNTFLAENSDFTLIEMKMLGAPELDADTMFVAVMERKAND